MEAVARASPPEPIATQHRCFEARPSDVANWPTRLLHLRSMAARVITGRRTRLGYPRRRLTAPTLDGSIARFDAPWHVVRGRTCLGENTMANGTVKWFNGQKGYGFIQPEEGGADVFVHISAVERAGMQSLREGQKVSYEMERGRNG